jgi:hypothetical protein
VVEDDALLARTKKAYAWVKARPSVAGALGLGALVVLLGGGAYLYFDNKSMTGASEEFSKAVADDRGRIGEPDKEDSENGPHSPRPIFKNADAKRESALKKYEDVRERYPKTGAAILARLAEGSLLLDKKDPDGAAAAFNEVKGSPLAAADNEVRGRALEGLGFAYELKSTLDAPNAAKYLDQALAVYKELENTVEVKGFKELAMYHQARCLVAKGDKDKAKELLVAARERIEKPGEQHPFPFLSEVVTERLRAIDPSAVPAKPPMRGMPGMGGGMEGIDPEMLKQILQSQKH